MKPLRRISAEYLAGFIDGEGSIRLSPVTKSRRYQFASIMVCNTNLEVMKLIHEEWGGVWIERQPKNVLHKRLYIILWNGRKGYEILEFVRPYLIIKKRQADLISEFQSTLNPSGHATKRLTSDVIMIRERIERDMHGLNRRGNV